MPSWLPIFDWRDLLDVALVASLVWLAVRAVRRTRARRALTGLALLAVVYLFARGLELQVLETLLQGFFAVSVLLLVVVFQEELRRVFEQLGSLRASAKPQVEGLETLDLLVRTVARLASSRTGALFVLPGRDPLDRHIEGGVALDARASEPLLLSLFDASSPGHDGAVILAGPRVARFAVHLPHSSNHAALGPGGTRHAAALGLAERSDAICIVVSEERGTVSVARDGEIRTLVRPEDLVASLRDARGAREEPRRWWEGAVGRDAALAAFAALVLWWVVVPGATVETASLSVPVDVTNLPEARALEATEPDAVLVTLRGSRRDLLLARRGGVSVEVDGYLARLGRRTFDLSSRDVRRPSSLTVVSIEPERIRISLSPDPAGSGD